VVPDSRIAHTVPSGLQVTSETVLKTRIGTGRNRKVVPAIGAVQRPEFTQFSIWFQREFDRFVSVVVENFYLGRGSGAIVDSKDNAMTLDIVSEAAREVGLATGDASLKDAEERIRTKD
jgi:hypothetical protein